MRIFFVTLATVALLASVGAMRQQAVGVKGRLLCGEQPAAGVDIKLMERDIGM